MAVGKIWVAVGLEWIVWRAYADSLVPMDAHPAPCDRSEPEVTAERTFGGQPPAHGVGDGRL